MFAANLNARCNLGLILAQNTKIKLRRDIEKPMVKALFTAVLFICQIAIAQEKGTALQPMATTKDVEIIGNKTRTDHAIFRKSIVPGLLFVSTAGVWHERKNVGNMRNRYVGNFHNSFDDYLQYLPGLAVYGLQLSGEKGKHRIDRVLVSHGLSLLLMGIVTNSIKYSAKIERPDGSKSNSFPSGHTALAFTNATVLHKEYGEQHGFYSIAGYGMATITGVGRVLNNRHWVSDVLAGAGIGIAATELGYFFADRIYKDHGENAGFLAKIEGNENPSFLALKMGSVIQTKNIFKETSSKRNGFELGLEGAYFFKKNWGIGADIAFMSFMPVKFSAMHSILGNCFVDSEPLGFLHFGLGPYFSHEFAENFQLMLKSSIAYSVSPTGKLTFKDRSLSTKDQIIGSYLPENHLLWTNGLSFNYKINSRIAASVYADYLLSELKIATELKDKNINIIDSKTAEKIGGELHGNFNAVSVGAKLTAYF